MLQKLLRHLEDIADDLGYLSQRGAAFILGKTAGQAAGEGAAMLAGPLVISAAAFLGVGASSLAGLLATSLAAGAVAGISVGLVHADFRHRRTQLVDRYREEVGAILKKAPDKITEQDLQLIARGDFKRGIEANPAIRKELKNSWLDRNVGVVLSTLAAVTTFIAIHTLVGFQMDPGGIGAMLGESHSLPALFAEKVGEVGFLAKFAAGLAINGLLGFATYHTIKTPLHMLSEKVFGMEENTVNSQITEVKRTLGHGHEVAPEQVFGVFISAHHDIAEQLKAEYGKEYDEMNLAEKKRILTVIQQYMDINGLTADINKGRMRPEELAFISFGQQSGVGLHAEGTYKQHGNVIDGMWRGLAALTHGFHTPARPATHQEMTSYVGTLPGQTTYIIQASSPDDAHMQVENQYEEPGRKQSFVARVGRKVEDKGLTHVERLDQASSQEVVVTR